MRLHLTTLAAAGLVAVSAAFTPAPDVDWAMVAKIREEGLQRSRVMDFESYMTDVLGARLTLSRDMQRAQKWALGELTSMGLVNVAAEPFMDFGVTWDNEYVSLQMLEPDYSPMVGYPIAHTAGTNGRKVADAVIVELATKEDLAKYKGTLKGKAVLSTPPPVIDLAPLTKGVPRLTEQDLEALERTVIAPPPPAPRPAPNPNALTAVDRMRFFKDEGVAVVLQSESGWLGAVRGYSRPDSKTDRWSHEKIKTMTRNTSPNESKLLNEYLNMAFAKNIAKKDAKTLMYNAEITANL